MTPGKDIREAADAFERQELAREASEARVQVRDPRTAKRIAADLATRGERHAIREEKRERLGLKSATVRL